MAELTVWLSWRWMFWFYVPIALVSMVLVWRYFLPDRPTKHTASQVDRLAPLLFVAWVVAIVFAFSWYRKWGGWTSNAFAATVLLCVALPVFLAFWLGSNFSPDEHLKRLLRTRVFVLSMTVRGLMLAQLVGVLTIPTMTCISWQGDLLGHGVAPFLYNGRKSSSFFASRSSERFTRRCTVLTETPSTLAASGYVSP